MPDIGQQPFFFITICNYIEKKEGLFPIIRLIFKP